MALKKDTGIFATKGSGAMKSRPAILCVDDDPDVSWMIKLALSMYDVDIIRVYGGNQAVLDAAVENPDLIITDLNMPKGNGEELISQLRNSPRYATLPVIVLSGESNSELWNRVRAIELVTCLKKPVQLHQLLNEIKRYVELRSIGAAFGRF